MSVPASNRQNLNDRSTDHSTNTKLVGVWLDAEYKNSIERGTLPCACKQSDVCYIITTIGHDTFSVKVLSMNNDNDDFIATLKDDTLAYGRERSIAPPRIEANNYYRFRLKGNDTLEVIHNKESFLFVKSLFEDQVRKSSRLGTLTYNHFITSLDHYNISPSMYKFLSENFDSFGCRRDLGGINLLSGKTNQVLVETHNDTLELYDIELPKAKSYPIIVSKVINSRWTKKR